MNKEFLKIDLSLVQNPLARDKIKRLVIPSCLTDRPLILWDSEQTKALGLIESVVDDIIDQYEYFNPDERSIEYTVSIQFSGNKTIKIIAKTKDELEQAINDSIEEGDIEDYDIISERTLS